MRCEKFTISVSPERISKCGMNKIYAGVHWTVRKKQAMEMHEITAQAIKNQCITPKMFDTPVDVEIAYNTRMDIDNHSYLSKMIIDGMKGLFIEDDTRKYVRSLKQAFHDGNRTEIIVKVTACDKI